MALSELDVSELESECIDNCFEAVQACEECARHDHGHCQVCADVVERCAESCHEMIQAA